MAQSLPRCRSVPSRVQQCILVMLLVGVQLTAGTRLVSRKGLAGRAHSRKLLQTNGKIIEVVVLGDSYSDTGNLYVKTNGLSPDPNWYWNGRFSDGPVWVEYLFWTSNGYPYAINTTWPAAISNASVQGLPYTAAPNGDPLFVRSFAVGGAPACASDQLAPKPGDSDPLVVGWLDTQINEFQGTGGAAPQERLVIIEIGGNDYLDQIRNVSISGDFNLELPDLVDNVVACIEAGARRLLDAGEKNIMLFTLPPVDQSPELTGLNIEPITKYLTNMAQRHNDALRQVSVNLQIAYPNTRVVLYEMGYAFAQVLQNATAYGITNTEDSCLEYSSFLQGSDINGRCSSESQYAWHDKVHPTTRTHSLLAQDIAAHLQKYGWR